MRVYLRWDGPSLSEVEPPYRLRIEAHRMLVQVGDTYLWARYCDCKLCGSNTDAGVSVIGPEAFAMLLAETIESAALPPQVEVVLMEHMVEPLADGSETYALASARAVKDLLGERGIACELLVPVRPEPYPDGTWLRVIYDSDWAGAQHLVVAGMLGRVAPARWVPVTPGVNVLVHMEGRKEPAECDWRCVVPIDAEPSEEELVEARKLCASAAELFQAKHGWVGLVSIGSEVVAEKRARAEIERIVTKLPELWQAGQKKDYAGLGKRLVKLLRGFSMHPDSVVPLAAASELDGQWRKPPRETVLAEIRNWVEHSIELPS